MLAALLLAVGAAVGAAAPASAHAELVASTPAPNASLVEGPESIALAFSEPIDADTVFIDLLDAQRVRMAVGRVRVSADGARATISVPPLDAGVYTVSYQVVSTVDGHATAGIFAFLVDPTGAAAPPTSTPASSSPSVDPATVAARWLALAGLLVALGSLTAWWQAARDVLPRVAAAADAAPPWRLVAAASALAATGVVAYLWLSARPIVAALGGDAGGLPFDVAAPFGLSPFALAMRLVIVASVAAAIIAFVRRGHGGDRSAIAVGGLLAIGLAGMSAAGHASSYGGIGFAALDWLHLVAVAAWLGGLPALAILARRSARVGGRTRSTAVALLRRHGRVALVAAPVVALTGIANSPVVLGASRELVASEYGNLLVAKAVLLSVAVGIGAVNHFAVRGRGRAAVGLLIGAELLVAIVAVSAAATMVTIQPAAARQPVLAGPTVAPVHLFDTAGPSDVHVSVNPPTPGSQAYQVSLTEVGTGLPRTDVQKVFVHLTPPPGSDLPGQRVELTADDVPGLFSITGAYTPVVGSWGLEVIVRRAGERDESVLFELPISAPVSPEPAPPPDTGVGVPVPLAALWTVLPRGPVGWLPALLGLAGLAGMAALAGQSRGRWTAIVRGALAVVVVIGGLGAGSRALVDAANAPALADLEQPPSTPTAEDVARGEAIYRANCASCHGIDGLGDGPIRTLPGAGVLADAVREISDAELSYRIAHGVAGTPMPAFAGSLTPEERWQLVAYVRSRWGEP
jgi:copper transport protein